jgi:hypothetical protein
MGISNPLTEKFKSLNLKSEMNNKFQLERFPLPIMSFKDFKSMKWINKKGQPIAVNESDYKVQFCQPLFENLLQQSQRDVITTILNSINNQQITYQDLIQF